MTGSRADAGSGSLTRRALLASVVLLALLHAGTAPARAERLVIKQLRSSSYKVRLQAAIYLNKLRDPKALDPLIRCVEKDSHYLVRAFCASALGKIGDRRALPSLERLRREKHSFVRKRAAGAIRLIEIQSPQGNRDGYQIKYKQDAKYFVLMAKPRRRRRQPRRIRAFTERSVRLRLNEQPQLEVARGSVAVPAGWLKKRKLPALEVDVRVVKVRRHRRQDELAVTAKVKTVVTRYPARAVALMTTTEVRSSQPIHGRRRNRKPGRREMEQIYRHLEREALDGAFKRISTRVCSVKPQ